MAWSNGSEVSALKRLVLIRHGQSLWNQKNRFTGWMDVGLSDQGIREAREAAELMQKEGYVFDRAYTSVLQRAVKTLWIIQEQMDLMWIPVSSSWRLNERHYGALQGMDKTEMVRRHGEEQVHQWRRSYETRPPELPRDDPHDPAKDPRYAGLKPEEIPRSESLKDTIQRFLPYWKEVIEPTVRAGRQVLIVAHGNSLRGLVKYLDSVSDEEVSQLNIPTGVPLVYELDEDLKPQRSFYLGNA